MKTGQTIENEATAQPLRSGGLVRPPSQAARIALRHIGEDWQKVPYCIRASHLAVLIRQGLIEHRWPFDLTTYLLAGKSYPWLRDGEVRLRPNIQLGRAERRP
jgi:hypothetical protein